MSACVLAVDDQESVRDTLVSTLSERGYGVSAVGCAEDALDLLRHVSFDLVLSDVRVPAMGGIRLARSLAESYPDLPVVLIAEHKDAAVARTALHCGAADLVMKPIEPASLQMVVECNLQRRALERRRALEQDFQVRFRVVQALAAAIDARQSYTAEHSRRVAELATRIGAALGFTVEDLYLLDMASQVHDLGKIGVPDAVLEKPARLTEAEWVPILKHPSQGAAIVAEVPELASIANVVRHHHERIDGRGYPDRLEGDSIPMMSRIIAVADAYDAMTTDRPYRPRLPVSESIRRLQAGAGSQFDPRVVDTCVRVLASLPPSMLPA